ncbi:unnamed protein product [Hydatigera taeniaeformis]|uniref:Uncharacterized protein n=1 Tax=Hydatigena taeniaeformis TaxID=6205 RepID=A0A0R3WW16_HYDTA|nr:unnamed protein product [Hydatigera taeniaeformis]
MAMRKDSIQTRKRRCAKKQRGNLTHLQQQLHHHQSLEPRLGSADVHEHLDAIKHQYSAAPTPYAFFPPPTVGTKPYTVSGALAPS